MREAPGKDVSGGGDTSPIASRGGEERSLRRAARTLMRDMGEQAATRPFRTVAVALGAGYVVGGGLFSPLTARLVGLMVRVGLRMAALPLVSEALGLGVKETQTKGQST
jgi:hypothetical protein